jgi:N-methylhydantoinase A
VKQYHEVSFVVPQAALETRDTNSIADIFHAEHNRLYGYSLKDQDAPIEMINIRAQALGITEKPVFRKEEFVGADPSHALKGERSAYIPAEKSYATVPVYDGHKMRNGNQVPGPAIIEQITTAIFVSESFDCLVDELGSFVLYQKGREDLVSNALEGNQP